MVVEEAIPIQQTPPVAFLSSEEFLDWLQPGIKADLFAGEVLMHSPVSIAHARMLNFVEYLLRHYISVKKLGEVFGEVVAVKFDHRTTLMPDLCFFTNDQLNMLRPNFADGSPTLAVEVLSPSSIVRDERWKFSVYERNEVQEYWILDPMNFQHRFFRKEDDHFQEFGLNQDVIKSAAVAGFFLRRTWLSAQSFPNEQECAADILRGLG